MVLLALIAGVGRTTAGTAVLMWNPSPDPNVVGYKIFYGTARENFTARLVVGNVTRAPITGLTDGTTYYFAAASFDAGGIESALSDEVSFTLPNPPPPANPSPTLNPIPNLIITLLDANAGAFARRFYRARAAR